MKASKDPFEAAEFSDESPPESPPSAVHVADPNDQYDDVYTQNPNLNTEGSSRSKGKGKAKLDEDYDEEEDMDMDDEDYNNNNNNNINNVNNDGDNDVDVNNTKSEMDSEKQVTKMASGSESTDPHKMAKMQSILSQFTEEQMTRYESFRRSGFQKSIMKRLLVSITGSQKISVPMTIVVSGIAKMFVGELVETARVVMAERKDSGPIRPCHIRESYRRLKLEGKIPKKSVPRLFK